MPTKKQIFNLNFLTMKKTFLFLACVAFLFTANAQEGGFKQAAGNKALEVNFAPLGGNPVGISGIQFKSYSSETSAMRMNIFIGYSNESKVLQDAVDTSTADPKVIGDLELKEKNSSLEIGLRPGIEKHFAGTDRLSPYIGAELDFAKKFSTKKEESQIPEDVDVPTKNELYTKTTKGKDGFMRVGVNAVAGFDYFFAKKLYIGAEFGFGVSKKFASKIKVKDEAAEEVAKRMEVTYVEILDAKKDTKGSFNIGPNVNTQIRIGWLF
ncbi:MAG: hypothetical protein A2033_10870 [Bacteroidetes bacterium GWA2_31_9]|nr:MAG: hypothetical protein A2033_10870 [Bacteroidetes bacterium GWA2_31_9]